LLKTAEVGVDIVQILLLLAEEASFQRYLLLGLLAGERLSEDDIRRESAEGLARTNKVLERVRNLLERLEKAQDERAHS
jgi:hypothetical protein